MEWQRNTKSKFMARKINIVVALALLVVIAAGCKKNDWLDWKVQNQLILEANKSDKTIKETSSGLQYRIISDDYINESRPHDESLVTCKYILKLPANKNRIIDQSSFASIPLVNAVPGFAEGVKKIHNHGIIEMWVPYDLGYGEDGYGSEGYKTHIPPYSTLYFYVDIQNVTNY